ncbi:DUF5675 family protein [Flavobacterium cerinum]|uniref:DUF5675 domain-containing protein n=1 Tax=Flavobacterium cerinum TaxID=2502784 RepID=A0A3S3QSR0_9FLAO|nr:DUF5675 family protein [Flavobacterium cerinum]RWX00919.1 hypothetical protein EPI11_07815 [Flavobacterium cerinum]
MMKAVLIRGKSDTKQTLGSLELKDATGTTVFTCKTLELDWENNKTQKSCIPTGNYKVTARKSPKYGSHFLVNDVPHRDTILIHQGNYHTEILGCILVGASHTDINKDGFKDVTSSKATLKKLLTIAPKGFELTIK